MVVDGACLRAIGFEISKAATRFALRVLVREAFAFHQVFDSPFEMELEFVVEVGVDASFCAGKLEDSPHVTPWGRGRR